MLECKKCYISNHDSTAVGLTFVLFGKSPKLKTSAGWIEAGWQSGWLSQGFVFLLFLVSSLDIVPWTLRGSEINSSKPLLYEMHPHFSMQQTSAHIWGRKAPDSLFFISSKTSTAQWNSNLLNKHRGDLLLYYLSPRRNIKLIAAKHFKDWKYRL